MGIETNLKYSLFKRTRLEMTRPEDRQRSEAWWNFSDTGISDLKKSYGKNEKRLMRMLSIIINNATEIRSTGMYISKKAKSAYEIDITRKTMTFLDIMGLASVKYRTMVPPLHKLNRKIWRRSRLYEMVSEINRLRNPKKRATDIKHISKILKEVVIIFSLADWFSIIKKGLNNGRCCV